LELRVLRQAPGDEPIRLCTSLFPLFNPHPVEPSERVVPFTTQLQRARRSICGRARKATHAKRFTEGGTKGNFQPAKVAKSPELGGWDFIGLWDLEFDVSLEFGSWCFNLCVSPRPRFYYEQCGPIFAVDESKNWLVHLTSDER
jgi:hypothetical protein